MAARDASLTIVDVAMTKHDTNTAQAAPVAQLDSASASEAEGYWFEPSRAY